MPENARRAAARRRIEERRAAEDAARAQRRRRTVVGGVAAAVLLAVAVVVVVVVQTQRTATSATAAVPANTADGGDVVVVGPADAPVTVDLYFDYQCPNCKAFEDADGTTLEQLVAAGTVQVHHHGMAFLDTDANDRYSTRALNAAAAVVDAAGPDAFQRFSDLLYAHQPPEGGSGLTDEQLIGYAAQAGASGAAVERAIRDLTYADWVAHVTDQASRDGVTGTPTVLVDGQRLSDLSPGGLTAAVQAAQHG
ncbi:disulfide bond formation protein DsbA [Geodermatophilus sp. TF02-6]|uniref:DsbA family protein n=1 Tax=Geodermatophilus sp. TF02-6 TaxID=2250575 RepID=UPI000DE9C433|nr:thioredoxin domain-containing protein [Geodermatophilus sp. TF02-6]RBY74591.1 disulfide bond formation protein DsbA [Geodermatophilus sp. TF02-6]